MDLPGLKEKLYAWFDKIYTNILNLEDEGKDIDDNFCDDAIINLLNYFEQNNYLLEAIKWLDSEDGSGTFDYDMRAQIMYEQYQKIRWDMEAEIPPDDGYEELTDQQILEAMRNFLSKNPERLVSNMRFT